MITLLLYACDGWWAAGDAVFIKQPFYEPNETRLLLRTIKFRGHYCVLLLVSRGRTAINTAIGILQSWDAVVNKSTIRKPKTHYAVRPMGSPMGHAFFEQFRLWIVAVTRYVQVPRASWTNTNIALFDIDQRSTIFAELFEKTSRLFSVVN